MSKSEKNSEALSFEKAMEQLDDALKALSAGDLPLEEAIRQYQTGIDMVRICQQKLSQAQQKIKILQDGMEVPFTVEE